jgi:hypothetical protein
LETYATGGVGLKSSKKKPFYMVDFQEAGKIQGGIDKPVFLSYLCT